MESKERNEEVWTEGGHVEKKKDEKHDVSASSSQSSSQLSVLDRKVAVLLGLCVGDSLGATSEYVEPTDVGSECVDKYPGWPGVMVGGGKENWEKGAPTDDSDMALALLHALKKHPQGKFDAANVVNAFFEWRAAQKDIGATTKAALSQCSPTDPYTAARNFFRENPHSIANGSLMRNGSIPAWFSQANQEIEALDATVLHAIITHFSPTSTVTCVLQTLLVREALIAANAGKPITAPPTIDDIQRLLHGPWQEWKTKTQDPNCKEWLEHVGTTEVLRAEQRVIDGLQGFEEFDPYRFA